jgi:DNA replication protein DnaC
MRTLGKDFSDLDNPQAVELAKLWVSKVEAGMVIKSLGSPSSGVGMVLVGEPGHGKTTLASVAVQTLIRNMSFNGLRPALFMDYPKLLRLEKKTWDDDNEDDVADKNLLRSIYGDNRTPVSILILDDLGKEYRTQAGWSDKIFDSLVRARFNAGLPTIITTNVPLDDWEAPYGAPMASFVHEAFMPIEVRYDKGDRRRL